MQLYVNIFFDFLTRLVVHNAVPFHVEGAACRNEF